MNNYTTIRHKARIKLGLNLNEYCIADMIYHLSNNPKGNGWCYASKNTMSDYIGISERQVMRIIDVLIEKDLIIKNLYKKRELKTTELWYDEIIIKKNHDNLSENHDKMSKDVDKMSVKTMTKCHKNHDKMSVNSNNSNIDNNKDSNIYTEIFEYWNNKKLSVHKNLTSDIIKMMKRKLKDYTVDIIKQSIDNYDIVLKSKDHYWTKKWGLIDFLSRGVYRFTNESDPINSMKLGGFNGNNQKRSTSNFKGFGEKVQKDGTHENLSNTSTKISIG